MVALVVYNIIYTIIIGVIRPFKHNRDTVRVVISEILIIVGICL